MVILGRLALVLVAFWPVCYLLSLIVRARVERSKVKVKNILLLLIGQVIWLGLLVFIAVKMLDQALQF